MSEKIIIVAFSKNGTIGKNGKMPWHIKEDFQRFKKITTGHTLIMGRKTWDSLPTKPLPNRKNIVLTKDKTLKLPEAIVRHSFEETLEETEKDEKVFFIGGATIYKLALKIADKMEITLVHEKVEGDTEFPEIDFDQWNLVNEEKFEKYSFITYKRKNSSR